MSLVLRRARVCGPVVSAPVCGWVGPVLKHRAALTSTRAGSRWGWWCRGRWSPLLGLPAHTLGTAWKPLTLPGYWSWLWFCLDSHLELSVARLMRISVVLRTVRIISSKTCPGSPLPPIPVQAQGLAGGQEGDADGTAAPSWWTCAW